MNGFVFMGLAGAIVMAPGLATAEVTHYYRWQQPNGTVVFSENPPPVSVKRYTEHSVVTVAPTLPEEPTVERRSTSGTATATPESNQSPSALARRDLARAEQARIDGRDPLPGERQRLANGATRLTPEYYERQRRLDEAVANAQAGLGDAD